MLIACSSLPDLHFADATEGGAGEGGPLGEGGSDGGADGPIGPCTKSGPEICDDGIDNDCNGHIDCDDPACTAGFACSDPAPSGWDLVGFAPSTRPACPPSFGASTDVSAVAGTGAGTCTCQCGAAVGSTACNAGQATATVSDQAGCTGGTTDSRSINASAAACTPLSSSLPVGNGMVFVAVTPPAPPAACAASTTLPGASLTDGRVCAPPARVGGGCSGTQVCAPKPTGMALCAAKTGAQSCPATYPKLSTAGTTGTDSRACNTCTCTPESACTETATLFTASDCTIAGAEKSIPLASSCASSVTKNVTAKAYRAVSGGSGCAATGFNSATTGSIAWTNQETICCK